MARVRKQKKEETPVEEVKEEEVKEEASVKEEPKEEAPVEKPKKETTKPKNIKSFEDVFEMYKEDPDLKILLGNLKRYVDTVFGGKANDGQTVAAMNYDLYNNLLSVLKNPSYGLFKKQFDLINKIFMMEANGKFNVVSLSRYDHFWTYGGQTRMNYHTLIELISTLANPSTRTARKSKISINQLTKTLPEQAVNNLTKYYNF